MLAKLAFTPVRLLAESLLRKFIGKYVSNIDLAKEGNELQWNEKTCTITDLELNCSVSWFQF